MASKYPILNPKVSFVQARLELSPYILVYNLFDALFVIVSSLYIIITYVFW